MLGGAGDSTGFGSVLLQLCVDPTSLDVKAGHCSVEWESVFHFVKEFLFSKAGGNGKELIVKLFCQTGLVRFVGMEAQDTKKLNFIFGSTASGARRSCCSSSSDRHC